MTNIARDNDKRLLNLAQASLVSGDSIAKQLDLEKKLGISSNSKTSSSTTVRFEPDVQCLFIDPNPFNVDSHFNLKSSPSTIGPGVVHPTPIVPPSIIEPTESVQIIISDKRSGEKVIVGDQPSPYDEVEIIGDRMDNVVKKEAIRILQIKRTKMNRHKLLKWRKKFKHLIKTRIEKEEKQRKKELDDAVAAIHGDADVFNPVDKVRRHVELAKDMGYTVSFYKELPLTKWLKEKEEQDAASAIRFEDRNRERYRKKEQWEDEKF